MIWAAALGGGCASAPPKQPQGVSTEASAGGTASEAKAEAGDKTAGAGASAAMASEGAQGDRVQGAGGSRKRPTSAELSRVMAGAQPDIMRCYAEERKRDPKAQGRFVLHLVIGPQGAVQETSASSRSDLSEEVVACVEQVARKLTFPAPGGDKGGTLRVAYPINMSPLKPGQLPEGVTAEDVKVGPAVPSGFLPPKQIQQVVRQSNDTYRTCYEAVLARDPNAQGRLTIRFVIGRDGRVSNVGVAREALPDDMAKCVVEAFYKLRFPKPEGGIVTVSYPIVFSPGE